MTMLTDEQQVHYFNLLVPTFEAGLISKGVPQTLANLLAVETTLSYIQEAKEAPGLDIPVHSYGIKVRLENGDNVNLWVRLSPPKSEDFV